MSDVVPMETRPERLWREYVDAQNKAKSTLAYEDCIAAGRAWSAFLAEYVPDSDKRHAIHSGAHRR
jgi:hypothetical protein